MVSTYVEMILKDGKTTKEIKGDLHVCGDDPERVKVLICNWIVISTYVEMILVWKSDPISYPSDLHVCGDDP